VIAPENRKSFSIPDILRRSADEWGDSVFLKIGEEELSFGWMEDRSNRAANLFREIGVRKGDKVGLAVSTRPEFVELWFGLAKLGAIMVPVDPTMSGDDFGYVMSHSDSKVLVVEDSDNRPGDGPVCNLPKIRCRIWVGDNRCPPPGFMNYAELVGTLPPTVPRPLRHDPADIMAIVYTSGTTGVPKGAILSQHSYCNSGTTWSEHVVRARADDVFYTTMPLSHITMQTTTVVGSLIAGRPLVLGRPFDPGSFLDDLRSTGATVFGYGGAMIHRMLLVPPRTDDREIRVRLAFGGAVGTNTRREFEDRFGITLVEGYHLTECAGMVLVNSGEESKEGLIGKPLPGFDVMVVDEFDEEMPAGLSGEIVVRPKVPESIFLGYYREHDRTAENMRNGWLHTGDRGFADADGDIYFLDRKVDSIRRGREIFSSHEIERIVNSHPGVRESAATGVLSGLEAEDVCIFVVLKAGERLSPEEIATWCAGRMSTALVPRYVEIVTNLPKTVSGEIRKQELRRRSIPGIP
jgi:crotonobetaine/carnitine-CoA ligase